MADVNSLSNNFSITLPSNPTGAGKFDTKIGDVLKMMKGDLKERQKEREAAQKGFYKVQDDLTGIFTHNQNHRNILADIRSDYNLDVDAIASAVESGDSQALRQSQTSLLQMKNDRRFVALVNEVKDMEDFRAGIPKIKSSKLQTKAQEDWLEYTKDATGESTLYKDSSEYEDYDFEGEQSELGDKYGTSEKENEYKNVFSEYDEYTTKGFDREEILASAEADYESNPVMRRNVDVEYGGIEQYKEYLKEEFKDRRDRTKKNQQVGVQKRAQLLDQHGVSLKERLGEKEYNIRAEIAEEAGYSGEDAQNLIRDWGNYKGDTKERLRQHRGDPKRKTYKPLEGTKEEKEETLRERLGDDRYEYLEGLAKKQKVEEEDTPDFMNFYDTKVTTWGKNKTLREWEDLPRPKAGSTGKDGEEETFHQKLTPALKRVADGAAQFGVKLKNAAQIEMYNTILKGERNKGDHGYASRKYKQFVEEMAPEDRAAFNKSKGELVGPGLTESDYQSNDDGAVKKTPVVTATLEQERANNPLTPQEDEAWVDSKWELKSGVTKESISNNAKQIYSRLESAGLDQKGVVITSGARDNGTSHVTSFDVRVNDESKAFIQKMINESDVADEVLGATKDGKLNTVLIEAPTLGRLVELAKEFAVDIKDDKFEKKTDGQGREYFIFNNRVAFMHNPKATGEHFNIGPLRSGTDFEDEIEAQNPRKPHETDSKDNHYEGETNSAGEWHGEGTYTYPNGGVYKGGFKEGEFHGKGSYIRDDMDLKENGTYKNGVLHGEYNEWWEGVMSKGQYTDGLASGKWTKTDKDGRVFTTEYKDGERGDWVETGKTTGKKENNGGDKPFGMRKDYKGDTNESGERHGKGTMTYADSSKYVGGWEKDMRQGQGKYTYADSSTYEGGWKNNLPHGQGKYTYSNSSTYVGGWKNNEFHGQGKYTYADGSTKIGQWKDGKFVKESAKKEKAKVNPFGATHEKRDSVAKSK